MKSCSHSHDHGADHHGPDHEHGPNHKHGTGLFGHLWYFFSHTHALHERVDAAMETHERGIWALKVSLLGLGRPRFFRS